MGTVSEPGVFGIVMAQYPSGLNLDQLSSEHTSKNNFGQELIIRSKNKTATMLEK